MRATSARRLPTSRSMPKAPSSMAETSGGFAIRNTNDLGAGLARISRESRSYYLIGYVPQNDRADGRFRQIEVKVKRPGVRVRARKGYFAVDAESGGRRQPRRSRSRRAAGARFAARPGRSAGSRDGAGVRPGRRRRARRGGGRRRPEVVPARARRRAAAPRLRGAGRGGDAAGDRRGVPLRADDGAEPASRDQASARRVVVSGVARVHAAAGGVSGARRRSRSHQRPHGQRDARVRGARRSTASGCRRRS